MTRWLQSGLESNADAERQELRLLGRRAHGYRIGQSAVISTSAEWTPTCGRKPSQRRGCYFPAGKLCSPPQIVTVAIGAAPVIAAANTITRWRQGIAGARAVCPCALTHAFRAAGNACGTRQPAPQEET